MAGQRVMPPGSSVPASAPGQERRAWSCNWPRQRRHSVWRPAGRLRGRCGGAALAAARAHRGHAGAAWAATPCGPAAHFSAAHSESRMRPRPVPSSAAAPTHCRPARAAFPHAQFSVGVGIPFALLVFKVGRRGWRAAGRQGRSLLPAAAACLCHSALLPAAWRRAAAGLASQRQRWRHRRLCRRAARVRAAQGLARPRLQQPHLRG